MLPKIERARDAIRSHNDFDGSDGEKNVTSLEQLSIDFRVKSSLCATTSNALDACAKELVKCANANASRGVRLIPSSSRSDEVMQLRCVFLGRSGVGKSHVVNSLLRRACVPKGENAEGGENDDDDYDDELKKVSGYETAREDEDEEEPPPMLQSPGKKNGVEDDINAMVLDGA